MATVFPLFYHIWHALALIAWTIKLNCLTLSTYSNIKPYLWWNFRTISQRRSFNYAMVDSAICISEDNMFFRFFLNKNKGPMNNNNEKKTAKNFCPANVVQTSEIFAWFSLISEYFQIVVNTVFIDCGSSSLREHL